MLGTAKESGTGVPNASTSPAGLKSRSHQNKGGWHGTVQDVLLSFEAVVFSQIREYKHSILVSFVFRFPSSFCQIVLKEKNIPLKVLLSDKLPGNSTGLGLLCGTAVYFHESYGLFVVCLLKSSGIHRRCCVLRSGRLATKRYLVCKGVSSFYISKQANLSWR